MDSVGHIGKNHRTFHRIIYIKSEPERYLGIYSSQYKVDSHPLYHQLTVFLHDIEPYIRVLGLHEETAARDIALSSETYRHILQVRNGSDRIQRRALRRTVVGNGVKGHRSILKTFIITELIEKTRDCPAGRSPSVLLLLVVG